MEKNVGGIDRTARLIVGPVLIVVGLAIYAGLFAVGTGAVAVWFPIVALILGAVLAVTGYTQKCPIWRALGVNTYKVRSSTTSSGSKRAQ